MRVLRSSDSCPYSLPAASWRFIACCWILWLSLSGCNKESQIPSHNLTVYIGSGDRNIYALDALTGAKKWSFQTSDAVTASPTLYEGLLYAASLDGTVYALDTADGKLKWSFQTAGSISVTPLVSAGKLYIANNNDSVYALDLNDRIVTWSAQLHDPWGRGMSSSPTIENGQIYIGGPVGWSVDNVNAQTGQIGWADTTLYGYPTYSSPCYGLGMVFAGSSNGKIYAMNDATGKVKWSFSTNNPVFSSPTLSNGRIYIGALNNTIYCIDAASGAGLWNFQTSGAVYSCPVVVDGILYAGDESGNLYALNAFTGAQQWMTRVASNNLYGGPTVANGMIYLGSLDDHVYAVDATTGMMKWAFLANDYIISSPCVTASDGTIFHPGISGEQN